MTRETVLVLVAILLPAVLLLFVTGDLLVAACWPAGVLLALFAVHARPDR